MMHQEVKYRVEEEKQEDLSSTSATTRTETSTSLDVIVVAFEGLAELLNSGNDIELRLDTFCDSCSLVSVLFSCLGIAFKFAEMEYVAKVHLFFLYLSFYIVKFLRFLCPIKQPSMVKEAVGSWFGFSRFNGFIYVPNEMMHSGIKSCKSIKNLWNIAWDTWQGYRKWQCENTRK